MRLIYKLEKELQKNITNTKQAGAAFYREKGYLILDWLPALMGNSSQAILVNTFLQAGIFFQKASVYEAIPAEKMADEKLALRLYLLVMGIAHHATPDIELYAYTHCLKYISQFTYDDFEYADMLAAFQHRCLVLADMFPFFQYPQSNTDFFLQEDKSIILMRQLLHVLVDISDANQAGTEKVLIDHDYVKILYQAYEACLKNWYEKNYQPETEKSFRLKLMQELLTINRWTFFDLDCNLDFPWVMVDRDDQGWMVPTRSVFLPKHVTEASFNSLDGFELNYKSGELTFLFNTWKKSDPSHSNVLSLLDLNELLEREITSAIFSLDPVDPDLPYHPFNKMRFAPSSLYQSQLLRTMLLTDYLLKFLTVGQEVQGRYPYDRKTLETITQNLPDYLKKIIDDFHIATHTESLHRFWIEAEEVSAAIDQARFESSHVFRFALGEIKMVVKKHVMMRDASGNLVDKEEEGEGWDFYILTSLQKEELLAKRRTILGFAIIFIDSTNTFYFLENGQLSKAFTIQNYDHQLRKLFKLPRDTYEKIIINPQVLRMVYRVTRELAKQSGMPHRFSPEFIFAQEFTAHYNEFAQYFPEFARLRELSKATALVRVLDTQRTNNEEQLNKFQTLLNDVKHWQSEEIRIKGLLTGVIKENFSNWGQTASTASLRSEVQQSLNSIRAQIGTLTFTSSSPEVQDVCQRMYRDMQSQVVSKYGSSVWNSQSSQIWSQGIVPKIPSIVAEMNTAKYNSVMRQLTDIFSPELSGLSSTAITEIIRNFLYGTDAPLRDNLVSAKELVIRKKIQQMHYPKHSLESIGAAMNGNIASVVTRETNEILERNKQELRQLITERKSVEAMLKKIGLSGKSLEVDLTNICLWVPASIRHDVGRGNSRTVYGGVHIAPNINIIQTNGQLLLNHVQLQTPIGVAQVIQNKIKGDAFRDQLAQQLRNAGREVEIEVTKQTPFGRRVMDIEVRQNGLPIGGIETKTGNSRYTPAQRAKDTWLKLNSDPPYPVNLVRQR